MPKLIKTSDQSEIRPVKGNLVLPDGSRIQYADAMRRWSADDFAQHGMEVLPDPPPPPSPPPLTPRQRVEQGADGGIMSALVDLLAEDRGITREALLDDMAGRLS